MANFTGPLPPRGTIHRPLAEGTSVEAQAHGQPLGVH